MKEEGKEDIKKLSANPYLANLEDFLGTTDTMKRLFSALIEIERTLIRYMMMQYILLCTLRCCLGVFKNPAINIVSISYICIALVKSISKYFFFHNLLHSRKSSHKEHYGLKKKCFNFKTL